MKNIVLKLHDCPPHSIKLIKASKGLAIHKQIINLGWNNNPRLIEGKEYVVTHINSSFSLGKTFKLLRDAKTYLEEMAAITDWSLYPDADCIPADIRELARKIFRRDAEAGYRDFAQAYSNRA